MIPMKLYTDNKCYVSEMVPRRIVDCNICTYFLYHLLFLLLQILQFHMHVNDVNTCTHIIFICWIILNKNMFIEIFWSFHNNVYKIIV